MLVLVSVGQSFGLGSVGVLLVQAGSAAVGQAHMSGTPGAFVQVDSTFWQAGWRWVTWWVGHVMGAISVHKLRLQGPLPPGPRTCPA